jgi:hypothetical protein
MRSIQSMLMIIAFLALVGHEPALAADGSCTLAALRTSVAVSAGDLRFADLFLPTTCPAILEVAGRIFLGRTPLAGSPRVLDAAQIGMLLEKLQANAGDRDLGLAHVAVPERISIRRTGSRTFLLPVKDRNPRSALTDAVPATVGGVAGRSIRPSPLRNSDAVVHRGETVTLCWNQAGIIIRLRAVCLDSGAPGDPVRARMVGSARIIPAKVAGRGLLTTAGS